MNELEIINHRLQAKKDEFTDELSYSEKAVLRAIILEYEQLIEEITQFSFHTAPTPIYPHGKLSKPLNQD